MILLVLLASLSFAQSSTTVLSLQDQVKLQNVRKAVEDIYKGRPTLTGRPTFKNGICFGNPGSGDCQTSAATSGGNTTIAEGSTLTVNGFMVRGAIGFYGIPLSSGAFSAVTVATVTLPSTMTYQSYIIVAHLKNVNAAARSLMVQMGTDTASGYAYTMATAASNETNNAVGCEYPAGRPPLSYTAANATNVGVNAWVGLTMSLSMPETNFVIGSYDMTHKVGTATSIIVRDYGGFQYSGAAVGHISFFFGTTTSCTVNTQSADSLTGTVYVYGVPR